MIPKRRNLISLIFIVNCISKFSLIKFFVLKDSFYVKGSCSRLVLSLYSH